MNPDKKPEPGDVFVGRDSKILILETDENCHLYFIFMSSAKNPLFKPQMVRNLRIVIENILHNEYRLTTNRRIITHANKQYQIYKLQEIIQK